ncbi:MAG: DUF1573 domain-containing protein [Acidobacteriota bacterium]
MRRLLITALLAFSASAALAAGPEAVPVEPVIDFEIVPRGEKLIHTFEIRNEGDQPLEITSVRPACGCTIADFDKVIAPGKIGKIKATVDTSDFFGPIAKAIAVFTNDSDNPKLALTVKANVKPFIAVVPGYARFNYVQDEPMKPIGQTIWAEDGREIQIVDVGVPYDWVDIAIRDAVGAERDADATGNQLRLEVSLTSQAPVGALRQYIEVTTNHPKQPKVKIPLSGFVRPRSHVTPMELDFGQLDSATLPLRRTLHFTNFATQGIEVQTIEAGLTGISAEVKPSENQPGHRFQLLLTLSPDMPKGTFDTVLRIRTTDTANPIVEVPVKGTVL